MKIDRLRHRGATDHQEARGSYHSPSKTSLPKVPLQTSTMQIKKDLRNRVSDDSDPGVCSRITQACCPSFNWGAPSDVNAVQKIYTPPHPTEADLAELHQYADKIEELKNDKSVMGIAFAINEQGDLAPVYVRCVQIDEYQTNFGVYNLANDKCLGDAITHPSLHSNRYCQDYWPIMTPEEHVGYGSEKGQIAKVWLDNLRNFSSFKNIGVLLNKAIHQKFENECEGRMIIDAVRKTHPYHYKLGFRAFDPRQNGAFDSKKNSLYAKYVTNHEIPDRDLGSVPMLLPEEARELWLTEIREYPIEFPTM